MRPFFIHSLEHNTFNSSLLILRYQFSVLSHGFCQLVLIILVVVKLCFSFTYYLIRTSKF